MTPTRITIALVLSVLVSVAGCYYDKQEVLTPVIATGCDTTSVTFSKSVAPLLAQQCYGCHSDANAKAFGDGIRLQQYSDVAAKIEDVLAAVTWQQGFSRMPKDGAQLSACQINTLLIWSRNGAKND